MTNKLYGAQAPISQELISLDGRVLVDLDPRVFAWLFPTCKVVQISDNIRWSRPIMQLHDHPDVKNNWPSESQLAEISSALW